MYSLLDVLEIRNSSVNTMFRRIFKHIDEPQHDKTNKSAVRPAKTQISLGIHPVWSESSLSASFALGP